MTIIRIINCALNVLFPLKCPFCSRILDVTDSGVCRECICKLPIIRGSRCMKCSKPVDSDSVLCGDCGKRDFSYNQGYAVWHYNKLAGKVIAGLKYNRRREYVEFLSSEMAYHSSSRLRNWEINALIPVPLHRKKLRNRGFNQAELLAEAVGHRLDIPVRNDILIRRRNTKPQKYLDDNKRSVNVKNAFSIASGIDVHSLKLKNVVIVDDIYTTGSTIEACAELLIKEGIPNVYFLSLCIGDGY